MKYGETFQRWSIPEWHAYNVDYNEIKSIIKERTTNPQPSAAIAVPGQRSNSPETSFEDELFDLLQEQHERVNLFVRSKTGEIKRRLDHLDKATQQLRRKTDLSARKKIPVKRLEKYSKFENETLKTGEEVQSLARFITAQEQAFRKLLKKYRKWTGSFGLELRFKNEVLDKPRAYALADVNPLVSQYEEVLEMLRAPFDAGLTWSTQSEINGNQDRKSSVGEAPLLSNAKSAATELKVLCDTGSNIEFDTGLATVPLGNNAGYTSYWVHQENIVQLQVLLSQHARLRAASKPSRSSSTSGDVKTLSRQESATSFSSTVSHDSDLDLMILDDAETFAKRRSTQTIKDLESGPGRRPEEASAAIRCGLKGDAIINVDAAPRRTRAKRSSDTLQAYVSKKKSLRTVFEALSPSSSGGPSKPEPQDDSLLHIQSWCRRHPEVTPLVRIWSKRARYVGLENTSDSGLWATLDKGVSMKRCTLDDLDRSPEDETFAEEFPHAILGVRWEGQTTPELINVLDGSHLVERVLGFSIATHAVASLCKPAGLPAPFWASALEKDIRKLPSASSKSRKGSATAGSSSATTNPTSTSNTSVLDGNSSAAGTLVQSETPASSVPDQLTAPPLKAFRKKRRNPRSSLSQQLALDDCSYQYGSSRRHYPSAPRYWNEFDDGEETAAEEYTILIDPNAPEPLSEFWAAIKTSAEKTGGKIMDLIKPKHESDNRAEVGDLEQQALLHTSQSEDESDSTPDSPARGRAQARPAFQPRYSTFPSFHRPRDPLDPLAYHQHHQREVLLLRCTIGAFFASYLLLIFAAALEVTRRKRYIVSADIGVVVGVIASIVFAAAGVALGFKREGGWVDRAQVGVAFALSALGNGVVVLQLVGS